MNRDILLIKREHHGVKVVFFDWCKSLIENIMRYVVACFFKVVTF